MYFTMGKAGNAAEKITPCGESEAVICVDEDCGLMMYDASP
jgi:hypothetical protein